jgi:hypothetical protein
VVSNGAIVAGPLDLDFDAKVTITDGSTISDSGTLYIVNNNQVFIINGGQHLGNPFAVVGGNGNKITVAGSNARWGQIGQLHFGYDTTASNSLIIGEGGSVDAAGMVIGKKTGDTGSVVTVAGSLTVTNGGTGQLQLWHGQILLQQGIITVDLLAISASAAVMGCGTIVGNINNSGTLAVDCPGGTLSISGTVTNNGSITATNNADIEFLGPVVNYGTINVVNGSAHFPGGFINHGSYQDAGTVLNTPGVNLIGSDLAISFGCVSGKTYAVEYRDDLVSSNWAALVDGIVAMGGTTQIIDAAAANLPQRFYRVHLYLP